MKECFGVFFDGSIEVNAGWSDNNDIYAIGQGQVTTGGSYRKMGYEVTVGPDIKPLHNISYEVISMPSPVPGEVHVYYTKSTVHKIF